LLKLELGKVKPNNWNCNFLTEDERQKLKHWMSLSGPEKTPPIIVRHVNDAYEIVDGEQRWRAAGELGWLCIYAIEVESEDSEAKALCISYNLLKGRMNWFKLCDIIDKEMKEACRAVLNNEEIEKALSLRNIHVEARRILEKALLAGFQLTLDHLHVISLFPLEIQRQVAENALKYQSGVGELKTLKERLTTPSAGKTATSPSARQPQPKLAKPGEPTKHEGTGRKIEGQKMEVGLSGGERLKRQLSIDRGRISKAEETEAFFTCECGKTYQVNYETRKILWVKKVEGLSVFTEETTYPASLKVKCPECGLLGEVDVEVGEVKWDQPG
jgi:ParB-like chromosome segregation protein Spo0J